MNNPKCGLRLASLVFALIALAQLWRLIAQPEVIVAGTTIPLWVSAVGFIVLGGLCLWLWRLSELAPRTLAEDEAGSEVEPEV